jgi:hypothetical protein
MVSSITKRNVRLIMHTAPHERWVGRKASRSERPDSPRVVSKLPAAPGPARHAVPRWQAVRRICPCTAAGSFARNVVRFVADRPKTGRDQPKEEDEGMIQESKRKLRPPLAKPNPVLREAHLNRRPRLIENFAKTTTAPAPVETLPKLEKPPAPVSTPAPSAKAPKEPPPLRLYFCDARIASRLPPLGWLNLRRHIFPGSLGVPQGLSPEEQRTYRLRISMGLGFYCSWPCLFQPYHGSVNSTANSTSAASGCGAWHQMRHPLKCRRMSPKVAPNDSPFQ